MTKPIPELTADQQARFWARVDVRGPDECWTWTGPTDKDGYGKFGISRFCYRAHRIALSVYGRDPTNLLALHSCDNPPCVNPAHLFAGTDADNVADRDAKGRQSKGARHYARLNPERMARGVCHGRAKLAENDIPIIRGDTRPLSHIAAEYGVSATQIRRIKRYEEWAHVQ